MGKSASRSPTPSPSAPPSSGGEGALLPLAAREGREEKAHSLPTTPVAFSATLLRRGPFLPLPSRGGEIEGSRLQLPPTPPFGAPSKGEFSSPREREDEGKAPRFSHAPVLPLAGGFSSPSRPLAEGQFRKIRSHHPVGSTGSGESTSPLSPAGGQGEKSPRHSPRPARPAADRRRPHVIRAAPRCWRGHALRAGEFHARTPAAQPPVYPLRSLPSNPMIPLRWLSQEDPVARHHSLPVLFSSQPFASVRRDP